VNRLAIQLALPLLGVTGCAAAQKRNVALRFFADGAWRG
jgi:hypothetical protein